MFIVLNNTLIKICFFVFQANPNCIAVGSLKDIEEVDICRVLSPEPLLWAEDEAEREQSDAQRRRYHYLLSNFVV